jgi:rhomboid protease GluP
MTEPAPGPAAPPYEPLPRALTLLVALIALVEIGLEIADRGVLFDASLRPRVYAAGAFWAELMRGGEPLFAVQPLTMFVTYALLHGGFLHMAMNMTILLALGRFCTDRYGAGVFLPLFLAGAVGGGLAFGLLGTGDYPMVGASGAVFAFLGVWIAWDWRRHREHGLGPGPVTRRILVLAGINLVMFFGLGGLLAWEAHLGGFLAGLACGWVLENRRAAQARAVRAEARRRRAEREGAE